jgi:hypothetical protein
MAKVKGKDLEFWWDGVEIPIVSNGLSVQFDTADGTDSATPGDGKDEEILRAARTISIEANLYDLDGAEVASGTLTKDTRYRVTGGTITEGANTYESGRIFESDGTGIASSTNKVVPLGSRIKGKDMSFSFDGTIVPVTDIDFNLKYDELDATDSSTTGDSKETEVSRASRETKTTCIVRDSVADLLTTNPVKKAAILTFNSHTNITGEIIPMQKDITDKATDMAKVDYSFKWVGKPVETNLGLTAGVVKPFKVILQRGSSTNKEYIGSAVITSKAAKSGFNSLATITYSISINGALTENVAN